jgi:hypothetical protein
LNFDLEGSASGVPVPDPEVRVGPKQARSPAPVKQPRPMHKFFALRAALPGFA